MSRSTARKASATGLRHAGSSIVPSRPTAQVVHAGLLAFLVLLSLVLAGRSAPDHPTNVALYVISVLILAAVLVRTPRLTEFRSTPGLLGLIAGTVGLIGLHLLPLPPAVWTYLPGRGVITAGFEALGMELPWMPLSLDQQATQASAFTLFPGLCAIVLTLRGGRFSPLALAAAVGLASSASLLLGLAQVIGGENSRFNLYSDMNRGQATGFFANPNHLATLLLLAVPMLAGGLHQLRLARPSRSVWTTRIIAAVGVMAAAFGLVMVGSTAGVLLLAPVVIFSAFVLMGINAQSPLKISIGLLALAAVAGGAVMMSARAPTLRTSLGTEPTDRLGIAKTSVDMLTTYFPVGSGVGTFSSAYPLHEDPNAVTEVFINHAHNDYLEVLVEAGLPGLLLLFAFLLWWLRASHRAWSGSGTELHWRRTASVCLGIVAVHSLVDYPLRKAAIMVIAASCCAILGRVGRAGEDEITAVAPGRPLVPARETGPS